MVQLVLVVVQVLFATLALAGKIALRELLPPVLVLFRVSGAAAAFAVLERRSGAGGIRGRGDYARLALYSLLGVVANQLLYVQGLAYTTAINANILITTVPVFTLAIALVLRQERAAPLKVAGLALAMVGAVGLIGPGGLDLSPRHALGNAMIALNALCYAAYLVLSKDILHRYPPLTVITWVFAFGALGVLPFGVPALLSSDLSAVSGTTWLAVLFIIAFPTVASYWLSLWALRRVESSRVAIYVYIQPVVTVLIAPWLLGERLGLSAALAGIAIFIGIALVTFGREKRPPEEAVEETAI
jgi:drug/metabolite transporter (DMT)-like permease